MIISDKQMAEIREEVQRKLEENKLYKTRKPLRVSKAMMNWKFLEGIDFVLNVLDIDIEEKNGI